MRILTRIGLFLLTNIAVLVLLSFVMRVTGLDMALAQDGLNPGALLILSALVGFTGSFISLALSKPIAKWTTGARVIDAPRSEDEAWLLQTVRQQAARSGIGMPDVAIYPSADVNAFATGARRNSALVAVSEGLLHRMSRREVEAVLAHEVSHVANGDMITMTLLQGVVNTFVFFLSRVAGYVVDRIILKNEGRGYGVGYYVTTIVAQLALGLLASLIVMAFSRRREYRADAGAAALVGPEPMIEALRRLQSIHDPAALPQAMSSFGIRGMPRGGMMRLFMSHPPLEERIAALKQGGR